MRLLLHMLHPSCSSWKGTFQDAIKEKGDMIVATTNEKNILCHLSHVNSASQPNHGGIRRFQRDVFIILYYLNLLF